ncbi:MULTISPECIES: DoxX family protein [Flavobacteriaceae]|uniref:DoxX family protein n=1 Tax=Flavobacteriaceae TaxID=49546 RepID=UPI0010AE0F34|nr:MULTISPECIES: DoxX family protein [Flavobacteriaceae]NJB37222.1 DoxX family protein [Croceivirga sp. JEA036]TKD59293.1 DoxX family protein [Flavobacterium sp. ASW18X]
MNNKLIYRLSLGLFCLAMLGAVANSIVNYDVVAETFVKLGYPTYLIEILGAAQVLGVVLLVFNKGQWFIEWAYAGFFLNLVLGFIAHLVSDFGNGASAVLCLIPLLVTYILYKRVEQTEEDVEEKKSLVWHRV